MKDLLLLQRKYFLTDETKSYQFRRNQLIKLKQLIIKYETDILDALKKDLNKSSFEAYSTEVGFCLLSLTKTIKKLKSWMKVKKVKTPIYQLNTKSFIYNEPLGNILIIGPYNYPFQLVIEPLIGLIASGNTAIIKPSEYSSYVENILFKMINENFDPKYIHVVKGDQHVVSELIKLKFDHIFFTGSTRVGQIVYEAASKNLVPVTLELGGKSPTIVHDDANIKVAARRIAFGKFINAGQTCIAPDYIYAHEKIHDALLFELKSVIENMYADDKNLGTIVNDRHFKRLNSLIDKKNVYLGNVVDEKRLFISPTILKDVNWQDLVMQEEIFGPILPVLKYTDLDQLINLHKEKEKPLALYLFTNNKKVKEKVLSSLSFGGGAINDTIMHVSNPNLPFGGVGLSGIGRYHGKSSFTLFSNQKGYIDRKVFMDPPIAYPPHSSFKEKLIRKLLK